MPFEFDELAEIGNRYWAARRDTPIVLTITTTMDCNLGCYYCYESRSSDLLSVADIPAIVMLAKERLSTSGKRSLHVDWYGGEPLLNIDFLTSASCALQGLCRSLGVAYAASIISNGTRWPENVGEFISQHCISQVQISFDGLRENHNKRRHFRPGMTSGLHSSFDLAVELVDRLVKCVHVDLRINIDQGNRNDVEPLLDLFTSRGWFSGPFPVTVQPARLSAYSERSEFMRGVQIDLSTFDTVRHQIRELVGDAVSVEESETPDGYPFPRSSVCAALAHDSIVIGADQRLYRCGLQVSETSRAIDSLYATADRPSSGLPIVDLAETEREEDRSWWDRFDPTQQPNCSRCSFLPICWGGCPKKHLEGDCDGLAEQGAYWRDNLPRLVASQVGQSVPTGFAYSTSDQFRD